MDQYNKDVWKLELEKDHNEKLGPKLLRAFLLHTLPQLCRQECTGIWII